jgi:hypothetical protein
MKEFDADLAGAFDSIPYAAIAVLATGTGVRTFPTLWTASAS